MEPVGVDGLVAEASATVAVQLVGLPTWTDEGKHWTVVLVGWGGGGGTVV